MNAPLPVRVTIVDDHTLFAETLAIALRARNLEAFSIVPEPSWTVPRLGRAIVQSQPHVVLLDLDLGVPGAGMELVSALAARRLCVVIVTGSRDPMRHGEALAHGARAVVEKSASFHEIVGAVERVRSRLPIMPRHEREQLVTAYRQAESEARDLRRRFALLSPREGEVLRQMMVGRQVSEIARQRYVSESTVRTQVKAILAKLGVSSQLTAVGLAYHVGWQPFTDERERHTATG